MASNCKVGGDREAAPDGEGVMVKPRIADLFCGAGGSAHGLRQVGFYVVGYDIKPQPRYAGDEFHLQDALTVDLSGFDAVWASPPCQGYSIMHNLPWLKGREYPLLILPTLEMLEASGKPYVLENVMGARHGATGLKKRGLEAHGLKAGWLCGTMFGLPFYRHRLFATNWFWLAPGHPKHQGRILRGRNLGERAHNMVFSQAEDARGKASWPNRRGDESGHGLTVRQYTRKSGPHVGKVETTLAQETSLPNLANWQNRNGTQAAGVGVGHAKGWRLAAEAMGIDWMKREELTQAIPPAYSEFIGKQLMKYLESVRE